MDRRRKRRIVFIQPIILLLVFCVSSSLVFASDSSIGTDVADEALRWTKIGAIGSWMGSIFGAIALSVSILAFRLPQKTKLDVSIATGMMMSPYSAENGTSAYIITVKNIGMRPATITNIYLHFGEKSKGDFFVGMLNVGSVLQSFTPSFPKRLNQGESFDYYLLKDKLNKGLREQTKAALEERFSIRVDEVTIGTKYYKTKWTLGSFIAQKN